MQFSIFILLIGSPSPPVQSMYSISLRSFSVNIAPKTNHYDDLPSYSILFWNKVHTVFTYPLSVSLFCPNAPNSVGRSLTSEDHDYSAPLKSNSRRSLWTIYDIEALFVIDLQELRKWVTDLGAWSSNKPNVMFPLGTPSTVIDRSTRWVASDMGNAYKG